MPTPLKVLIVDDCSDDAELLVYELQSDGFDLTWKRVETEKDFMEEIQKSPDIIFSDYSMPRFSGLRAAKILQESGLDIPFILISGTVGEEIALEAMKHNVFDYLLKDKIGGLGNAVRRALEEKRSRNDRIRIS